MTARARCRLAAALLIPVLAAACQGPKKINAGKVANSSSKLVSLVSIQTLPTSIGPIVVGEVRNRTNGPIQFVKITAKLKDISGATIGEESGFTLVDVVAAGAKAGFSIPFTTTGTSKVNDLEAKLEANPGGRDRSAPLSVTGAKGQAGSSFYEVTGSITNNNADTVTFPKVVATFYDTDGRVVGAEFAFPEPENMQPGATGDFRIDLAERQKLVARWSLVAEGTPATGPAPASTPGAA